MTIYMRKAAIASRLSHKRLLRWGEFNRRLLRLRSRWVASPNSELATNLLNIESGSLHSLDDGRGTFDNDVDGHSFGLTAHEFSLTDMVL